MTESLATLNQTEEDALFAAVTQGDLAKLTKPQQLAYYKRRCDDLGLNPLNQPFSWLLLQGKLILYANRACTEELRSTRAISITITKREMLGDCYVVTAQAKTPEGRTDESTGAVPLHEALKGDARANAMMKAETKAKRRVTLSICGLGILDETEVAAIPEVQRRMEKIDQAAIEDQHAYILEKAEKMDEPEVAHVTDRISEGMRRQLFAAIKQRDISHGDLKIYLKEQHGLDSTKDITTELFGKVIEWLDTVAPLPGHREISSLETQLEESVTQAKKGKGKVVKWNEAKQLNITDEDVPF